MDWVQTPVPLQGQSLLYKSSESDTGEGQPLQDREREGTDVGETVGAASQKAPCRGSDIHYLHFVIQVSEGMSRSRRILTTEKSVNYY